VWRNLRRLGVPEGVLEDAAQDVFIVVHRRWDSYDADWSAVEPWLFGILLRVARSHRRSWWRRLKVFALPEERAVEGTCPASHRTDPGMAAERRERVELLERVLGRLSPTKRAVFVMVELEELSVPQAAESLGLNLNTVYSRLRVARADFERALEEERREATREGAHG